MDILFIGFREMKNLPFREKLFRYGKKTFGKVPESVEVHVARSPREEAYACVSEIRKMVRTRGYRYREIGVIVSNMDVYGDYLKQAFETYQLPFFMDHKRSILLNSFVDISEVFLEWQKKISLMKVCSVFLEQTWLEWIIMWWTVWKTMCWD